MKRITSLFTIIAFLGSIFLIIGCSNWEAPNYAEPKDGPIPVITSVEPPDSAGGGVNLITVIGTNFASTLDSNTVYFDSYIAEKVEGTASSITVRRPNLVSDSATVKVLIPDALIVAKKFPYKITSVYSEVGNFLEARPIRGIAVDADENLYVSQYRPNSIFKITPAGDKTVIGETNKALNDIKVSPTNVIVCMANDTIITQVDPATQTESIWAYVGDFVAGTKRSKKVQFGDFDQNGYFYTGGNKSGLYVLAPGDSIAQPSSLYASDKILCLRVYQNSVYILLATGIYRTGFNSSGQLTNEKVEVLKWSDMGDFASSTPNCFDFSGDGRIFVATDNSDPLLVFNPADGSQDFYYKGILPTPATKIAWGTGNYLYMSIGSEEIMLKIDVGITGAPYYGRGD
jgi:hypothetical protein